MISMNSVQKQVVGKIYLKNPKIMYLHEVWDNPRQLLPPFLD